MPDPTTARAQRPEDLLPIIRDAINRADIDAFLAAHDDAATVVMPPDGRPVRGHDEIRAAMTPLLAMQPRMETVLLQTLVAGGLALSHSRWRLALSENGSRSEMRGLGTMVSRRGEDGAWRIVLDDPLTAPGQEAGPPPTTPGQQAGAPLPAPGQVAGARPTAPGRQAGAPLPALVDRARWQAEVDALRLREKAHTREGDAIAAARRRLPMVEVDPAIPVTGPDGPVTLLDVFEGRRQLVAYFHMWYDGRPAAEQCEGCTFFNGQVRELSYLHSRDVTYATFCEGPYERERPLPELHGLGRPWYSARGAADALLAGRRFAMLACYLRDGDRVYETYWSARPRLRGHGRRLRAARPDRLRPPGDLGGLSSRLAPAVGGRRRADAYGRAPRRPVVPAGRRAGRRPGHGRGMSPDRVLGRRVPTAVATALALVIGPLAVGATAAPRQPGHRHSRWPGRRHACPAGRPPGHRPGRRHTRPGGRPPGHRPGRRRRRLGPPARPPAGVDRPGGAARRPRPAAPIGRRRPHRRPR